MQLLLTSAAPSNIGRGGDTIIQTQNCVSPCAWVKQIFSVSRIVIYAQGQCSLRHTTRFARVIHELGPHAQFFQATRFARVILEQGAMSSSRNDLNLCVSSLCKPYHCIVQIKNYPSQILNVILVQGPCSNIQSHTTFVQKPCNSVQKKKLRHPCAGAMRQCPAEDKASGSSRSSYLRTSIRGFHRFAPHEHHGRSFRRETWR